MRLERATRRVILNRVSDKCRSCWFENECPGSFETAEPKQTAGRTLPVATGRCLPRGRRQAEVSEHQETPCSPPFLFGWRLRREPSVLRFLAFSLATFGVPYFFIFRGSHAAIEETVHKNVQRAEGHSEFANKERQRTSGRPQWL